MSFSVPSARVWVWVSVRVWVSVLLVCCQHVHSGYHTFLATRQTNEMATHSSMKAFNPQADDLTIYAERLQHYLVANSVEDTGKKHAILLTVCGASTYKLLHFFFGVTDDWKWRGMMKCKILTLLVIPRMSNPIMSNTFAINLKMSNTLIN